jgi:hypothetical protein
MSAMQSIFGAAPQQQLPQQQQTTPGNIPASAAATMATTNNPATAPNGAIPATTTGKDGGLQSPDAAFADLWKTDTSNQSQQGQPLFNVSREKLLETARLQDFKQAVTPEQMTAIAAGGEGAVSAMMDMINAVTQQGYAQSVFATTKLIEGALEKSNFAKQDQLATTIRDLNFQTGLRETNPVFSNPVFSPLMETAQKQFQVKYPTATAAELQGMAVKYVESMVQQYNKPNQEAAVKKQAASGVDWSSFA